MTASHHDIFILVRLGVPSARVFNEKSVTLEHEPRSSRDNFLQCLKTELFYIWCNKNMFITISIVNKIRYFSDKLS